MDAITQDHRFSLIVPCFNEEESLPFLYSQVRELFDQHQSFTWEVIFVDDGSSDSTCEKIRQICSSDERIKAVILSRNFGHQAALTAGLKFARGDSIGIIDCDLQDPIEVLLDLQSRVMKGECDVAFGVRRNRDAPFFLKLCYYSFYRALKKLADHQVPEDSGDFCVMSRRALDLVLALPEQQRFFRGLRSWVGLRQVGVEYSRPKRTAGESKYNFWRLLHLAISGFTGFSLFPLRLASFMGFGLSFSAVILAILLLLNRFFSRFLPFGYYIGENPGITTVVLLVLGAFAGVFLCLGIIGEYLAVVVIEVKRRPAAMVASTIGFKEAEPGNI
ncbi:MAG: glycosyltransferase family 2 protein [Verrucomicrobiota bacterium]